MPIISGSFKKIKCTTGIYFCMLKQFLLLYSVPLNIHMTFRSEIYVIGVSCWLRQFCLTDNKYPDIFIAKISILKNILLINSTDLLEKHNIIDQINKYKRYKFEVINYYVVVVTYVNTILCSTDGHTYAN